MGTYDDWKLETPEEERERYARLWRRQYQGDPDLARDEKLEKEREELNTYGDE